MQKPFQSYVEDERENLRQAAEEFTAAYPEAAEELRLHGRDPDVDRLLDAFAVLVARTRQHLDAELPELLYPVMNQLWPSALRPTPAAGILEFSPRPGVLRQGIRIERGALVKSVSLDNTQCVFRTCAPLEVHPLQMESVRLEAASSLTHQLWLRLRPSTGASIATMGLRSLRLHLHGATEGQVYGLYLWLAQDLRAIRVRTLNGDGASLKEATLPASSLQTAGWREDEGLIPYPEHSFTGFRHLHEYFMLPQKHLFVELGGLEWLAEVKDAETLEIGLELTPPSQPLPPITRDNLRLHCVPVVNLFPHPARTIRLDATRGEYQVKPDGNPDHYDVYSVEQVDGNSRHHGRTTYLPFYSFERPPGASAASYQLFLRPGRRLHKEAGEGGVSYPTIDTFIAFADAAGAVVTTQQTISIDLLATNRNLPHRLKPGDVNEPTKGIPASVTFTNLGAFTSGVPAGVGDRGLWRYYAQLTMAQASVEDLSSLRCLLELFNLPGLHDQRARKQLERLLQCITGVSMRGDRRLYGRTLLRGSHTELQVRENGPMHRGELYLFGAVLSHFLTDTAPLNHYARLSMLGGHGLELRWEPMIDGRSLEP